MDPRSTRHVGWRLAAALLLVSISPAIQAQPVAGPAVDWCAAAYGPDGGYVSCGYASRAQCVEALSGVGGICHENPFGPNPPPLVPTPQRRHGHT